MPISPEALYLEDQNIGENGLPTLARAYQILKRQWEDGDKDREIGLHLLFLAWYGLVEPPHTTGFEAVDQQALWNELQSTFNEVHDAFRDSIAQDSEMLYVVGLMVFLFPNYLGNSEEWGRRSKEYQQLYRAYEPNGILPSIFEGRGAYGAYFAHQTKVSDRF